jgi:hypothetical protein
MPCLRRLDHWESWTHPIDVIMGADRSKRYVFNNLWNNSGLKEALGFVFDLVFGV